MNYNKNFLSKVIFQANFQIDTLKDYIDSSLIELCKAKTGAELTKQKNTNITLLPNNIATNINSVWIFKGDVIQITIQSDFVQVINLKYTKHEDYHPVINDIFAKIKELYKPRFTRIALRYINNISFSEGNTYDFNTLINNSLLGATLDYKDFGLTRSIGQMNIKNDREEINTAFTYGFINPEFPKIG